VFNEYVQWVYGKGGLQLVLRNVSGLNLKAPLQGATIVAETFGCTLSIQDSSGVTLERLDLRHTEPDYRSGGGIFLKGCEDVRNEDCILSGGGTGLQIIESSNVHVRNSTIQNCIIGGVSIHDSEKVKILHTMISENES
jgi:hypothetical protein